MPQFKEIGLVILKVLHVYRQKNAWAVIQRHMNTSKDLKITIYLK